MRDTGTLGCCYWMLITQRCALLDCWSISPCSVKALLLTSVTLAWDKYFRWLFTLAQNVLEPTAVMGIRALISSLSFCSKPWITYTLYFSLKFFRTVFFPILTTLTASDPQQAWDFSIFSLLSLIMLFLQYSAGGSFNQEGKDLPME